MAMSDCNECWNTPCDCGAGYKDWTLPQLLKHKNMFEDLIIKRIIIEDLKCSGPVSQVLKDLVKT
jgi:hypothetical protein